VYIPAESIRTDGIAPVSFCPGVFSSFLGVVVVVFDVVVGSESTDDERGGGS
jgi:hypothetical protein